MVQRQEQPIELEADPGPGHSGIVAWALVLAFGLPRLGKEGDVAPVHPAGCRPQRYVGHLNLLIA